jgi:hypothetical protein
MTQIRTSGDAYIRFLIASHFKMSMSSEAFEDALSSGSTCAQGPVQIQFCISSMEACLPSHNRSSPHHESDCPVACVVHTVEHREKPIMLQFEREHAQTTMYLQEGTGFARLSAVSLPDVGILNLAFLSVEVVMVSTWLDIKKEKEELAGDISWMRDVPYALFFHWNSHTMAMYGGHLPYHEAVDAFNVDNFSEKVYSSGARLVVFTTTWAGFYFPAPIAAIDRVVGAGRTTKRDLIADMAAALEEKGIRLMLYYHYGKDDQEWWARTGFGNELQNERFWKIWVDIITEVGERYGELLSGLWIDDGTTGYYSRSPPFRRMWKASKAGNPKRLVGYNPWVLPSCTLLQDLYLGEMTITDSLPLLSNIEQGVVLSGSHQGLYATFSSLLQAGDWTYMRGRRIDSFGDTVWDTVAGQVTDFPPLLLTKQNLIRAVLEAKRKGALSILNLLISQEGFMCPAASQLLANLAEKLTEDARGYWVPRNEPLILESTTAVLGPDHESGPVYWGKEHVIVAWHTQGAFAAWTILTPGTGSQQHVRVSLQLRHASNSNGLKISVAIVGALEFETTHACAVRSVAHAYLQLDTEVGGVAEVSRGAYHDHFVGTLRLPVVDTRACVVIWSHGSPDADMYLSALILDSINATAESS